MIDEKLRQKHLDYLKIAAQMSTMSKCQSVQVACLFVRENRIISTGINGTPAGFKNCDWFFDKNTVKQHDSVRTEHHIFSDDTEIHAEMNAIIHAAKEGISLKNCALYCTVEPCNNCVKHLVALGIKDVFYTNSYDILELNEYNKLIRKEINITKMLRKKLQIKGN